MTTASGIRRPSILPRPSTLRAGVDVRAVRPIVAAAGILGAFRRVRCQGRRRRPSLPPGRVRLEYPVPVLPRRYPSRFQLMTSAASLFRRQTVNFAAKGALINARNEVLVCDSETISSSEYGSTGGEPSALTPNSRYSEGASSLPTTFSRFRILLSMLIAFGC